MRIRRPRWTRRDGKLMTGASRVICLMAAALITTASSVSSRGEDTRQDPSQCEITPARFSPVGWRELTFGARKLMLSAHTVIRVEAAGAQQLVAELVEVPPGHAAAVPGAVGSITKLTVETRMPLGRRELAHAWLDRASGEALQGERTVSGGRPSWKLWRYTEAGYHQWRAEPASAREERRELQAWTRRKVEARQWQQAPEPGAVVTDSYSLIYLLSAARLEAVGAELVFLVPSRDRLVEVRFTVTARTNRQVSFEQVSPRGTLERSQTVPVWVLVGQGRYLGSDETDDDVDTGFMGMRGGITVLVEQGSGLPVEVSGDVHLLGHVVVTLEKVSLQE